VHACTLQWLICVTGGEVVNSLFNRPIDLIYLGRCVSKKYSVAHCVRREWKDGSKHVFGCCNSPLNNKNIHYHYQILFSLKEFFHVKSVFTKWLLSLCSLWSLVVGFIYFPLNLVVLCSRFPKSGIIYFGEEAIALASYICRGDFCERGKIWWVNDFCERGKIRYMGDHFSLDRNGGVIPRRSLHARGAIFIDPYCV